MNIVKNNTETIQPVKKGDSIVIIGRKWFDKSRGSTYFSAIGLINGKPVVNIPYDYGYDDHYIEMVFKQLRESGYIPDSTQCPNGANEQLHTYCDRIGITLFCTATNVSKRKDL